jgi:hypothetical protein
MGRVSVWPDRILEMDRIPLWLHNTENVLQCHWILHFKMVTMVNFMYFLYKKVMKKWSKIIGLQKMSFP